MAARRIRGDRAFVRLLQQLPDEVTKDLRDQLNRTGQMLLSLARRRAPAYKGPPRKGVVPGALQEGLSYSVPPKRLSLKVGLVGKPINRRLFYGWIVEMGRKAQVVTVTRRGTLARTLAAGIGVRPGNYKSAALLRGIRGAYQMHVRAMPPRHFVYAVTREQIYAPFRGIWSQALNKAAAGASDD